jgi:hypothetical protein
MLANLQISIWCYWSLITCASMQHMQYTENWYATHREVNQNLLSDHSAMWSDDERSTTRVIVQPWLHGKEWEGVCANGGSIHTLIVITKLPQ